MPTHNHIFTWPYSKIINQLINYSNSYFHLIQEILINHLLGIEQQTRNQILDYCTALNVSMTLSLFPSIYFLCFSLTKSKQKSKGARGTVGRVHSLPKQGLESQSRSRDCRKISFKTLFRLGIIILKLEKSIQLFSSVMFIFKDQVAKKLDLSGTAKYDKVRRPKKLYMQGNDYSLRMITRKYSCYYGCYLLKNILKSEKTQESEKEYRVVYRSQYN